MGAVNSIFVRILDREGFGYAVVNTDVPGNDTQIFNILWIYGLIIITIITVNIFFNINIFTLSLLTENIAGYLRNRREVDE